MKSRVRWVSLAALAMLTVAGVCNGAEPNYSPGRGSIGGQFGISTFRLDRWFGESWFGDYSEGAKNRFAFGASFRYVATPWLRFQVSPGLSWAGYHAEIPAPFDDVRFPDDHDKGDWLAIMVPISLQAQGVVRRGRMLYHVGAGPGLYRVWVQNHREVLKDPVTLRLHRALYPGASGELGVERFMTELSSTSVELTLAGHLAFSEDDEAFVSGLNSNALALELKVGLHYYFDTGFKNKEPAAATPKP